MPKRDDIKSVLVIGSGPIVIGQACEFDYSGTQACRVLRGEGMRVILVNSNPATIMTDPEFADATYVEPITPEFVEKIIAKERPDALLPTLGGQTALNAAIAPARARRPGEVRRRADRRQHRGHPARARTARSSRQIVEACSAREVARSRVDLPHHGRRASPRAEELGYPLVVRPSLHDGRRRLRLRLRRGRPAPDRRRRACTLSPTTEVLLEESILGWKEYELEVMRDTRRQRRGRLLDRERRPDGRPHRRLDHGRAGDDAHRPRVPEACATSASPSSARSASTPAAATSSSRSTRPTAASS